ncbi:Uu.00g009890.m01.CDS01 [Anthostomella pinea]|uniref:Uu.00g009890.m01.CDS01 n=1 Tax=Anthostomella pinea TaxID=933095 RepID=A0AAI8VYD2_9PEZI|nr:Uu.00g009890.m01.CDS01 [Anthostomella pinea]
MKEPHLQLFNPVNMERGGSFPQFALLPPEIRIQIWKHASQRHRIITVGVTTHRRGLQRPRAHKNHLGKPIIGDSCRIEVGGAQVLSKLLRVNRESRQLTLEVQRVHLPCFLTGRLKSERATLHFNPELDILRITPSTDVAFANLVFELKAYDPRDVGLLRLAADFNSLVRISQVEPEKLDQHMQSAFRSTLIQVEEVFFCVIEPTGRAFLGPLSGIPAAKGVWFNRSYPILAATPTFDLIARDPRPICADLCRVFAGTGDPRRMAMVWSETLSNWNIQQPGRQARCRYLLAIERGEHRGNNIACRQDAEDWLQLEDRAWTRRQRKYEKHILRWGGNVPVESPDKLEKASRPAVGFWLFPLEALGPLPKDEPHGGNIQFFTKQLRNMAGSSIWFSIFSLKQKK